MAVGTDQTFFLGPWRVEPSLNRISRGDEVRRVEPLVMSLLVRLAQQPGECVSVGELLADVWDDAVVTENTVSRAVSALRRALDDDRREPRYIETISKKGYQLVAAVSTDPPEVSPKGRREVVVKWVLAGSVLIAFAVLVLLWFLSPETRPAARQTLMVPLPVSTLQGSEIQPTLSRDGNLVAFAWDGMDGENWDIYVKDLAGEAKIRLTDHPAAEGAPAWSPDGTRLAFVRYEDSACGIYEVSSLGGTPRLIRPCSNAVAIWPTWSPDGQWIAVDDAEPGTGIRRLSVFSTRTGEIRVVGAADSTSLADSQPVFSPDGSSILFRRIRSEGIHDLFEVPLAGGEPRRLTSVGRPIDGHGFDRNGDIVFSANLVGAFQLWRVPREGGKERLIPIGDSHVHRPSLHPESGRIVYARSIRQLNIWAIGLEAGQVQTRSPVTTTTGWNLHPAVSPDGSRIAYSSDRSGTTEIWVQSLGTRTPLRLTRFEGSFVGTPRWAPNAVELVFDARPQQHADIYAIGADGRSLRRLTSHPADDLAASWSADGSKVFFSSNRSGTWEIWETDPTGGTPIRVLGEGAFGAHPSLDGRFIYFTRYGRDGLWRASTGGGSPERVVTDLAFQDWGNVAVVEGGLFYVARRPTRVRFLSTVTGEVRDVFMPDHPVPNLDVAIAASLDASRLWVAQEERSESDVFMVAMSTR